MINREKLATLNHREQQTFLARNPTSKAAFENAQLVTASGTSMVMNILTSHWVTPVRWPATRRQR